MLSLSIVQDEITLTSNCRNYSLAYKKGNLHLINNINNTKEYLNSLRDLFNHLENSDIHNRRIVDCLKVSILEGQILTLLNKENVSEFNPKSKDNKFMYGFIISVTGAKFYPINTLASAGYSTYVKGKKDTNLTKLEILTMNERTNLQLMIDKEGLNLTNEMMDYISLAINNERVMTETYGN